MTFFHHDPETCTVCQAELAQQRLDAQREAQLRASRLCPCGCGSTFGVPSLESAFYPAQPASYSTVAVGEFDATGALDFLFGDGSYKGYEDEDEDGQGGEPTELALVINEVREGRFLTNREGEVLLDALADEELAHGETLAELYDAQDRVEELDEEVRRLRSLLGEARDGLTQAISTIRGGLDRERNLMRYIDVLERYNRQLEADALGRSFIARILL